MQSTKDDKKAAAAAAAPADKAVDKKEQEVASPEEEAVKKLAKELRQAEAKRRLFRRTLNQYERIKKRFTTQLEKLTGADAVKDENTDKEVVVAVYRLLRNFCISYNTIEMADRNEDKQVFPAKFEGDLKKILSGDEKVIAAIQEALTAGKAEESVKVLPEKIDVSAVKTLNEFLEKHEGAEVLKKLEAELDGLTTIIDGQREDLKTKKADLAAKQPKKEPVAAAKKEKKAKKGADGEVSTEQRFRELIQEVNQRVAKIQLEKDDYKTYSDVQSEIDSFLSEAIADILNIKTNLKKRFDAVQSGRSSGKTRQRSKSRRRSTSRKPRRQTDDESTEQANESGQQSVFSKAQQL